MDDTESPTPGEGLAGGDRNAVGAINVAAIAIAGFGLVALLQGLLVAAGSGTANVGNGFGVGVVGVGDQWVRAALALVLAAADMAVAVGLLRLERTAYWAGLALLALHAILGLPINFWLSVLAVLVGVLLLPQQRPFRRAD